MMMTTAATIEKILSVTDTRQYEEDGDRWVPIAGSGHLHACDRCGRVHEVHAQVRLSDGRTITVGTGCMTQENADLARRFQRADRAAKRIAELSARIAGAIEYRARYEKARAALLAAGLPEIQLGLPSYHSDSFEARMGDARVVYHAEYRSSYGNREGGFNAERQECLREAYLQKRLTELGFVGRTGYHQRPVLDYHLCELRREIEKVEARLAEINGA